MILLTFSTALKYVLSLMLAMLGIIPYEAVPSTHREASTSRVLAQPLEYMPAMTFSGEISSRLIPLKSTEPCLISTRDIHSIETGSGNFCVVSNGLSRLLETGIQFQGIPESTRNIIILFSDQDNPGQEERTYFLSSGR